MKFECLLISGTSCSGKKSIASQLCKNNTSFEQVHVVTTREKRLNDTIHEYVSIDIFNDLINKEDLLVDAEYRGKKYGIRKDEYKRLIDENKTPILVLAPEVASKLIHKKNCFYFFFDTEDEILFNRYLTRMGKIETEVKKIEKNKFYDQVCKDRKYRNLAHYIFDTKNSIESSVSLIQMLWANQEISGPLGQNMIKKMLECGVLLKNTDLEMIKGASYDLRLGDEYYYAGKISKLSKTNPFLTIEPYDYAIVSCKETACMPRDIIAKFGLTVGLFCQGIILSNGTQIDPGFRGTLFCLLFNTSNRPVHIKRGKHYATIEFNKLIDFAEPYSGKYQDKTNIIDYIPENAMRGAINELKKEVSNLKKESHIMQNIYLGAMAIMFAIISIFLAIK